MLSSGRGSDRIDHAIRHAPKPESLVSKSSSASTHQSKRARRAAERRGATGSAPQPSAHAKPRSPILLITAIVGGIGVVVLGALTLLQGGQQAPATTGLVTPTNPTPLALADGRSLGKADAPVTLEVWSDFQCPVCGQFARTVEPALVSKYVTPGTLRIVHHDAAFQGAKSGSPYDESVEAAAGARCAAAQDGYWQFQDWAFANQDGENKGAFAALRLATIASAAGLDVTAWKACVATGTEQAAAKSETQEALTAGVNATPTMRLNGQTIVGLRNVAELGTLIEAAAAANGG
jgi:protein-disulfide isomerase